jgi:hypothetical protein
MKLSLILVGLLSITGLNASYPIIEEQKCINIMEEEIEYDETDSYHQECYATTVAEGVNVEGPSRIDSMTTLINITPMRNVIIYNYRVTLPKKLHSKTDTIAKNIEESNIKSNCNSKDVEDYILGMGVNIVHSYYMKNGDLLTSFKINKETCANIKK